MYDYRDTVKKLFTENNVSITEFCNKHGFRSGHISSVLRKETNRHLTIEQLMAVSEDFGVSTDSILFDKKNDYEQREKLLKIFKDMNSQLTYANQSTKLLKDIYSKIDKFLNQPDN